MTQDEFSKIGGSNSAPKWTSCGPQPGGKVEVENTIRTYEPPHTQNDLVATEMPHKEPAPAAASGPTPRPFKVVELLKVLCNTNTNHYLYDDGFCKSRKLADAARLALDDIDRLERELSEAKGETPCCQEWHTCTKRCGALAENWRMAAKEAEKALETLREDMIHKVMTATDDQINAAIRLEGRDPDDVAKITKNALTNALHTVELNKMKERAEAAERERDEARAQTSKVAKALAWEPPYQDGLHARVENIIARTESAERQRDELQARIDAAKRKSQRATYQAIAWLELQKPETRLSTTQSKD